MTAPRSGLDLIIRVNETDTSSSSSPAPSQHLPRISSGSRSPLNMDLNQHNSVLWSQRSSVPQSISRYGQLPLSQSQQHNHPLSVSTAGCIGSSGRLAGSFTFPEHSLFSQSGGNDRIGLGLHCSRNSLNSGLISSSASLDVHVPSLPALDTIGDLDRSATLQALTEASSYSCPCLLSLGIQQQYHRRGPSVKVPRASSTFNMQCSLLSVTTRSPNHNQQLGVFKHSDQQKLDQPPNSPAVMNATTPVSSHLLSLPSSGSPYIARKKTAPISSGTMGNVNSSGASGTGHFRRKCEDWLVDNVDSESSNTSKALSTT